MDLKILVLCLFGVSCCAHLAECSVEVTMFPIGNFLKQITNTSIGVVQQGINAFSNAVNGIITTVNRVEDRLRALLNEFRKLIVKGIPELSIPILDPLHVDRIDFDVDHEAARLKGNLEDVTVKHISKFVIDGERFRDLGHLTFQLDLNLTFPYLTIDGRYKVDGMLADTLNLFGKGNFWLHLIDFKLALSMIVKFEYPRLKLTSLDINIKLRKLENEFENLMNDKELSILFNKALTKIAPEAIDMLWPDLKKPIQTEVKEYINRVLENTTVASLARRIFNIM